MNLTSEASNSINLTSEASNLKHLTLSMLNQLNLAPPTYFS